MQSEDKFFARDVFEIIKELRAGSTRTELTHALNEVVKACQETGKSGSVTLVLKIMPQGAQFLVSDDIKKKVPAHTVQPTIMFADQEANLMRRDPKQMTLDDVVTIGNAREDSVEVDKETGEVIVVK